MSRAADLHSRIEQECRSIMGSQPVPGGDLATTYPAAYGLIDAAIAAIEAAIPAQFEHAGRTYSLRALLLRIDLGIHADPADPRPLLRGQTESLHWCGFTPGH